MKLTVQNKILSAYNMPRSFSSSTSSRRELSRARWLLARALSTGTLIIILLTLFNAAERVAASTSEETGKILTYPNEIRKSRGVGDEERQQQQQQPPRSHFRFRFTPPSSPPAAAATPAPLPPPAVPPFLFLQALPPSCSADLSVFLFSPSLPSSSQRNLRHWKTRLDSEFIKMHTANPRIRPEYPPSFKRRGGGLYFGDAP